MPWTSGNGPGKASYEAFCCSGDRRVDDLLYTFNFSEETFTTTQFSPIFAIPFILK
jgi:hypothetical protein